MTKINADLVDTDKALEKLDNELKCWEPKTYEALVKEEIVKAGTQETGYEELRKILHMAYDQCAKGKGRERHAYGPVGFRPWIEQPILANARQVGPGGLALQVMKKAQESVTMSGNSNFQGAKAEALGAIVYAAALYRLFEEMEAVGK